MIAYLTGPVLSIDPESHSLVVMAQNVGYKISVSSEVLSKIRPDQKAQLFIHTAVREDDIALYGFETKEEHRFFAQLLTVSGIGPKIALDILSAPLSLTQNAIVSGDIAVLTKIKGVGKKTAERMVLELKNKIIPSSFTRTKGVAVSYPEEAILALENLGYERFEVVRMISSKPAEIKNTEDIIKYFLRNQSA